MLQLVLLMCLTAAALWGQGAGGVSFRDWTAPAATTKSKIACGELRSFTSFELSVVSATVIRATQDVPEHCRISILIPPEINVEVNLPSAWNGRLYMFGNG